MHMKKFTIQTKEQDREVATLDLGNGHIVTRTWEQTGFFGGHTRRQANSHFTKLTCTCGDEQMFWDRPHSSQLDSLEHDADRRAVRDWLEAEQAARILAKLA